ncbi:MAG: hypothetical protein WB988_27585, partial [Candidatus Nitrosopolaris sp.]
CISVVVGGTIFWDNSVAMEKVVTTEPLEYCSWYNYKLTFHIINDIVLSGHFAFLLCAFQ